METDKYIDVSDGHFVRVKKTGGVQIKMRNKNGKPLISMLYTVILAPGLCYQLFSIITSMNSGHTCLFHKWFCMVFFSDKIRTW